METAGGTTIKLEENISLNVASKLVEAPFETAKFLEAGKVMDRGGFTKTGRALMKHGYRERSVYPKPKGNPAQVNAHGQKILEEILNHPERKIASKTDRFSKIEFTDVVIPEKGGVRFNSADNSFITFLEP